MLYLGLPMKTRLIQLAVLCLPLAGCAYTFTNAHLQRPAGVESIAIEAIYDTSREVLPHEMLWQSLQNAFAADGHLRVVPEAAADALVRAHIKSAGIAATGTNQDNKPIKDPRVFDGNTPASPTAFKKLTEAGEYRNEGSIASVVEVEVWNLRTRSLLLKQTYSLADGFRAIHIGTPGVNEANDHLRYQEAVDASFKTIAENVSRNVVRDLLVH